MVLPLAERSATIHKRPRKAVTQEQRETQQVAEWQRALDAQEEAQRCPVVPDWEL